MDEMFESIDGWFCLKAAASFFLPMLIPIVVGFVGWLKARQRRAWEKVPGFEVRPVSRSGPGQVK
jgi:hypothetical protein